MHATVFCTASLQCSVMKFFSGANFDNNLPILFLVASYKQHGSFLSSDSLQCLYLLQINSIFVLCDITWKSKVLPPQGWELPDLLKWLQMFSFSKNPKKFFELELLQQSTYACNEVCLSHKVETMKQCKGN